jgi:class 3 adenylate cyclase/predicted ATPase
MTFEEMLGQVRELLQSKQRVSYRALKRQFALDDDYLEDLKAELIKAERVAADEDGDVLVWTGGATKGETAISPASSDPRPKTLDARPSSGERRQLTVMFIDLVGSTTLSQQLDPEDYHARVVAYQTACHQVIARYEGHIAQYLGDGVLVYFGYPTAHEDDAVRAVRSGLEIVTAVSQLVYTPPLQVRIGIHTGPVMIGEIGGGEHTEWLALGDTPNIAARVQGKAEPNAVFISQATSRLVQGFFTCEAMGPQELKNVAAPLELYRVHGEGEAHTRFEVSVQKGLISLVGREEELGLLRRRWEQAKEGSGQVVLLNGEAGIGKSRLMQTLKEQAINEGAIHLEFRCSPYHQNSAFYPISEHLQRLLQFERGEPLPAKLTKLQHTLATYRFPQADTLPLLATLLSLPQPEGVPPLTLSPQRQKQMTQAALVAWLMEEAEKAAVYCVWEDLHWVDPSTLEVLTLLLDQAPTTRLLTLLTFRPDFAPPWRPHSRITQLTLSRLQQPQVKVMVAQVTGGKALPTEVLQQIIGKTDGVPLFVEELTKMVLESELVRETADHYELTGVLPPLAIPSTLQDSLMARLDRLSTVREIVQVGATLGREFSYELLHVVSPLDEETLQQGLRQLVDAELIYQHGLPPQAIYLFKHALIQDTAYQSLLKSRRQHYHQQISQVLEERFPETKETQPELLAHHYTEAGLIEQAIPYWQKAGQRASQRSANVEAVHHLSQGLELLKTLPDTPDRSQQELRLQLAVGAVLMATKGYASPDARQAYARARELCEQMGDTPQLFPVLYGLFLVYLGVGEHKTAHGLAAQLLSLAQRQQASSFLLLAHRALGQVLFYLGEPADAREHVEQGLTLYDPQKHNPQVSGVATDSGVACWSFAAWVLWYLGYPDQALKRAHEALTLARELSHPFSLAFALSFASWLHQFRQEGQLTQERAEALIALSSEQGFPYRLADGTIMRGWARSEQGHGEEGIAQIHQGIAAYGATGAGVQRPHHLALLAEACGKVGQTEEGLSALTEALGIVHKNGERIHEAELYRLKGELVLQSGVRGPESEEENQKAKIETSPQPLTPSTQAEAEAEACFQKAMEIAQRQQAKSLELRAVMSLAKLWQRQGKPKEAHEMLAEIYGWFTEGFDTKDLQDAKALLDELS